MNIATLERVAACEGKLAHLRVLSVDVGYGYTKAVAASGRRAIFPSVVAPDSGDVLGLGGVFGGQAPGHRVRVRLVAGEARSYLVGEAA